MNSTTPLMLSLALSAALLTAACNRDADTTPPADDATTAAPAEPAPAPAPAEPAPPAPAPAAGTELSFAVMDKNSDGGVTLDELSDTDMLHHHFTTADTDANGSLSQAEIDKHRADMAAMPAE